MSLDGLDRRSPAARCGSVVREKVRCRRAFSVIYIYYYKLIKYEIRYSNDIDLDATLSVTFTDLHLKNPTASVPNLIIQACSVERATAPLEAWSFRLLCEREVQTSRRSCEAGRNIKEPCSFMLDVWGCVCVCVCVNQRGSCSQLQDYLDISTNKKWQC